MTAFYSADYALFAAHAVAVGNDWGYGVTYAESHEKHYLLYLVVKSVCRYHCGAYAAKHKVQSVGHY